MPVPRTKSQREIFDYIKVLSKIAGMNLHTSKSLNIFISLQNRHRQTHRRARKAGIAFPFARKRQFLSSDHFAAAFSKRRENDDVCLIEWLDVPAGEALEEDLKTNRCMFRLCARHFSAG